MPIPKDSKGLTVKQKKFIKAYVANDGNGTKAALQVYDTTSEDVARSMSAENLAKPTIRYEIDKALEKHMITMDAAIAPIADGLKANRYVGEDGKEVKDHSVRLKASAMALKLMGAEQKPEDAKGNTIIFNQNPTFNSGSYKD